MIFRLSLFLFSLSACATVPTPPGGSASDFCTANPALQEARSKELADIVAADQAERANWQSWTEAELHEVPKRDRERRKRVGEIFGEGCFAKASDFASAALVYQHGLTADHFFQTFIWAQRAVELGDPSQERLMALGIDRYLVNSGRKQLFATQATKADGKPESCWCLQPIERSFPDRRRKEIAKKSLNDAFAWLRELNQGQNCPNTECAMTLKPTPRGSVPGFW